MTQLLALGAVAFSLVGLVAFLLLRRREYARARKKLDEAVKLELHLPASLHPVVDPDVCIGSGSCIAACPEGKILGLIDGVATLVNGAKCIGHGKCAAECPVDAIKLVFGSAERGVDLPEVDTRFESSRPGVHIIGELAGMGLIKNALTQGLQVSAFLRDALAQGGGGGDGRTDVAIVGAGPAGIAAAVGCRAAGLSFRILEQETLGGTIAHYPRQKLVMTEPVELPLYGSFGRPQLAKEELLDSFQKVLARAKIRVDEGVKVTGIDGAPDAFTVATSKGVLGARRVVLAIGRRGSPRKIGVPGEESIKVAYRLIDPQQYRGKQVLVVGGGDSALEAAIMLAEQSDVEVFVSYRRPEFGRCRPQNKQKIAALIDHRRVHALMGTEITSIGPGSVRLKNGVTSEIPNDYVIACLGGELPTEFLQSVGVSIHRHQGTKAMPNPALAGRRAPRTGSRRGLLLFALGALLVTALAWVGREYYALPFEDRVRSPLHAALRPSGLWGHGIGIAATLFMLLNFVYPIRKRLKIFKRRGPIAPWLTFHVFVGLMSPIVILFHSAFQWRNQLATMTYVSLVIVVVTGIIGRCIYGLVQLEGDLASLQRLQLALAPTLARAAHRHDPALDAVLARAADPPSAGSLLGLFLGAPFRAMGTRLGLRRARPLFLGRSDYTAFRRSFLRTVRLRTKIGLHRRLKRLLNGWRVFHVVLSILLLVIIGGHVAVSLHLGFFWIFK